MATGSLSSKFTANYIGEWLQQQARYIIPPLLALVFLLGIWQMLCSGKTPPLPPPSKVWQETQEYIWHPFFDRDVYDVSAKDKVDSPARKELKEKLTIEKGLGVKTMVSLRRVAIGYTASALIGISLGIAIGTNVFLYRAFDPIFQVLRTIPPLAWLPIAMSAFQGVNESLKSIGLDVTEAAALFVIFVTSIWPILMNTAVGVQQVPQDYRNVSRVLRLSKFDYFITILMPSAAPYIFTGLRIAVGLSWLAIVAAEMLTGGVGIGFFIWDSYNSQKSSELILSLVYIGLVGFMLDKVVYYLSKLVAQSDA
ncbi:nitrate ABC transporter permease [Pseudanabaena sp. 'Roaring Creek']|uniref:nitrate ABC transporter permease n=1 Tax=Pseudanabaena sp. 'Roaring Creek' TaxID=1681830 RepID=UPI0006D7F490|nr:nitrate ABC transporter permease [Pseudanabaena sp. 'Roaring Creek']